jgi:hypothetical protein
MLYLWSVYSLLWACDLSTARSVIHRKRKTNHRFPNSCQCAHLHISYPHPWKNISRLVALRTCAKSRLLCTISLTIKQTCRDGINTVRKIRRASIQFCASEPRHKNLTLLVSMCSIIITKYIHSSNTSTTFYKVSTGYRFRPSWAIIRPYIWKGFFDFSAFWDPKLLQRYLFNRCF